MKNFKKNNKFHGEDLEYGDPFVEHTDDDLWEESFDEDEDNYSFEEDFMRGYNAGYDHEEEW